MMKRTSLTKSGSTVTSSTATFVPPYQPLSPLTSNKQNSQEANSIYNILQESKRNNNIINNSKNTRNQANSLLNLKPNIMPSSTIQNLYCQSSQQQASNVNNTQLGSSHSANQLNTPSQNSLTPAASILNSSSKQSESLLQANQRLLMSAQKTASLHSNSSSLLNNYNTANNHQSSTSKSPLSHASTNNYRTQTQYTPTSQKSIGSNALGGISPKLLLTGGGIQGTKSASMFHSHRPSLTTNQSNNENISSQKQRRESKAEVGKKNINFNSEQQQSIQSSYGVQQSIQGLQSNFLTANNPNNNFASNILKESNSIKAAHSNIINSIMQQQQQQQSQQLNKDSSNNNLLESVQKQSNPYSKNMRINSCANLDSSHLSNNLNTSNNILNLTSTNTNANNTNAINQNLSGISHTTNSMNPMKNSNVHYESTNYYSNQLSTDRSMPRTPKSPKTTLSTSNALTANTNVNGSISSKSNLQFIFNTTAQTQNTDIDGQHNTDTTQMMNISQLSATTNNISTNNLTERNVTQTEQSLLNAGNNKSTDNQESTNKDIYYHKCSNHPDKKAKYIISNSQSNNNIYCSKCAIQFSKDGFQPIHIQDFASQQQQGLHQQLQDTYASNQPYDLQSIQSPNQDIASAGIPENETQAKLKEIVNFLNKINQQGEKWQELSHALVIKKKDVSNFYEKQYVKVEQQYGGLIEMVNKLKEQAIQNLNVNRERSVQIYKIQEKEIEESLTDFVNIKTDIEMNTDKIVNLIQMDDFCRIMNSYKEKLSKMTDFFSKIGSEFIDLAKFKAPAPTQFYQQIEQVFEIGSFSTTLVKKRVSEFMSIKRSQQQQSLLQNTSLQQSTQSNFNKDSILSPNIKSARISGSMIENYNSGTMSTRGSLSSSQYPFFNYTPSNNNNNNQNPEFGRMKNDQMMIIHEIQEDELAERLASQNTNQFHQSNQQSVCNSPVKTENSQHQDLSKKDIYVSFGNNKEASLHKAIQQVKNNHQNQQNQISNNQQYQYNHHQHHHHEQLQATPSQHTGVYIHQIKPLTDIIEHSNMNEEDEKSQPNTPELKQIDDNPSKLTPSSIYYQSSNQLNNGEQQKPFRNLFGGVQEETQMGNNIMQLQGDNTNNYLHHTATTTTTNTNTTSHQVLQTSKSGQLIPMMTDNQSTSDLLNNNNNNSSSSQLLKSPSQLNFSTSKLTTTNLTQNASMTNLTNSGVNNMNNSLSTAYKYGSTAQPGSTKSPRYSMIECEENGEIHNSHPLTFPISKNNNQLDDYVQMIERQNALNHFNDDKSHFQSNDEKQNNQLNYNTQQLFGDNSYHYSTKNYFSQPQTNASRLSVQSQQPPIHQEKKENPPQNNITNQLDDDEVIVTHDKQEDLDNPLFSSPGYKQ